MIIKISKLIVNIQKKNHYELIMGQQTKINYIINKELNEYSEFVVDNITNNK